MYCLSAAPPVWTAIACRTWRMRHAYDQRAALVVTSRLRCGRLRAHARARCDVRWHAPAASCGPHAIFWKPLSCPPVQSSCTSAHSPRSLSQPARRRSRARAACSGASPHDISCVNASDHFQDPDHAHLNISADLIRWRTHWHHLGPSWTNKRTSRQVEWVARSTSCRRWSEPAPGPTLAPPPRRQWAYILSAGRSTLPVKHTQRGSCTLGIYAVRDRQSVIILLAKHRVLVCVRSRFF